MIVADTGAIVSLIDRSDRHHEAFMAIYEEDPSGWVLPWAILPEVDHLVGKFMGPRAEEAFLADLAAGVFRVEWGREADLERARAIVRQYRALEIGIVDAVVIAVAERLRASAVATLDLRRVGAIAITHRPALLPRDH